MTDLCATCPIHTLALPAKPLTERQSTLLRYVADYIGRQGISPTYFEMAKALGVRSEATIAEHIDTMASKGWLRRDPGKPRAITLTPAAVNWFRALTDRRGESEHDRRQAWAAVLDQADRPPTKHWPGDDH